LIASHRSSQALKKYLNTGQIGEIEMDVDTAYASLDIMDRNVDDELVLTTYNLRVSDNPMQLDSLKNAVAAIAKSRKSRRINDFLNTGMISSEFALSEWPVGLENIGNTCYLNSLLQFYFTIKPLRDLVLNADDFKMPIDETSLKSKRVGSRNVSSKEVTRAQQCKWLSELLVEFTDRRSCRWITDTISEHDQFLQDFCNTRVRISSPHSC
jgi:ubiquitin carboxyl-terminal hydrolase 25/28